MSYIQPLNRHQLTMMSSLDDLVPPDHPVRLLDMLIDRIVKENPDVFGVETFGDVGRPAFSHATMLKQYFYGYCNSMRSSRRLETEAGRNIELIWLLGALSPDHWVIAAYRAKCDTEIKFVATKLRQFLRDNDYIAGKRMAVDGSKFKANARRDTLTVEKIEQRFEHIERDMEHYLHLLTHNDAREDIIESLDTDGGGGGRGDDHDDDDGSSWTDRETALVDRIVALQQEVESLKHLKDLMAATGQTYISPTDPEAHVMRTREGTMPAYNVQIVVDAKHHFIADSEVLTDENDIGALEPMVDSLIEELGITPEDMLADTGYNAAEAIERVEAAHEITCYVAQPRTKEQSGAPLAKARKDGTVPGAITFTYDAANDQYRCSEGKPLVLKSRNKRQRQSRVNVYQGTQCQGCPVRAVCSTSKYGRQVHRFANQPWREQFKARMKEYKSRILLALRRCMVEHPFGTLKWLAGRIPLLVRGLGKVKTEINLLTTAYNLKRLFHLQSFATIADQFATYRWQTAKT